METTYVATFLQKPTKTKTCRNILMSSFHPLIVWFGSFFLGRTPSAELNTEQLRRKRQKKSISRPLIVWRSCYLAWHLHVCHHAAGRHTQRVLEERASRVQRGKVTGPAQRCCGVYEHTAGSQSVSSGVWWNARAAPELLVCPVSNWIWLCRSGPECFTVGAVSAGMLQRSDTGRCKKCVIRSTLTHPWNKLPAPLLPGSFIFMSDETNEVFRPGKKTMFWPKHKYFLMF